MKQYEKMSAKIWFANNGKAMADFYSFCSQIFLWIVKDGVILRFLSSFFSSIVVTFGDAWHHKKVSFVAHPKPVIHWKHASVRSRIRNTNREKENPTHIFLMRIYIISSTSIHINVIQFLHVIETIWYLHTFFTRINVGNIHLILLILSDFVDFGHL